MEGEREEEREGITKGTGMLKAKLGLTEIILSTCRGDVIKVVVLGVTYHIVGEPSLPEAIVVQLPLFVWGNFCFLLWIWKMIAQF